jgi:xanthine dehydrogenase iron-sulfur cluster and FAD-binding subunit A
MPGTEAHPHEMTNSHLLFQEFDYYEPATLAEAIGLLISYDDKAKLMAGGTHLMVLMKDEREAPQALVNLSRIPGLGDIALREAEGTLAIGARATIRAIGAHPLVRQHFNALAEACAAFGSTQIQTMGTIGGNVCNGSPAADTVPSLVAFGASLELVGPEGDRRLPVEKFLIGPGKIDLRPGEILKTIVLPLPAPGTVSLYMKLSRVAADLAKASLAVVLTRRGETVADCRMAMGSVAPTVVRLFRAEEVLAGSACDEAHLSEAARLASSQISPIDDLRSTAWYRRELAGVMVRDAVELVWKRAAGKTAPLHTVPTAKPSNGHATPPAGMRAMAGERQQIELTVNGKTVSVQVTANELLLNVLREKLELTGAKYGCGVGECGACTVEIDGAPALGCLTLAVSAVGKQISTVEGLQDPQTGELDPLQQAFIDETGFQCGYCTPGILMTVRSLLKSNPHPSEAQIREHLKGNRCRCTGYASIVRSVLAASK